MRKSGVLKLVLSFLLVFCFTSLIYYKSILNPPKNSLAKTVKKPNWLGEQLPVDYLNRLETINKYCSNIKNHSLEEDSVETILKNREVLEHLLVDTKHKILYCYVPKVACTNWKRVFMIMIGMVDTKDILSIPPTSAHQQHYIPSLINFTRSDVKLMLRTYTKFVFVRHPFERLLSAYKNKFEQNYNSSKYFQSRFGRKIVKTFRANASQHSLTFGDDVTFSEFVAYVTAKNSVFNEHWTPIDKLCDPCSVGYDYIGKHETLNADAQYLLDHIGVGDLMFPRIKPTNTSNHLSKYMSQLTYKSIISLYKIYYKDFKLFQYSLQSYLGYELE